MDEQGKDKGKVVVLGGSFNPPTTAHLSILNTAVDAIGAKIGLFTPVSSVYLERKMKKLNDASLFLTEEQRVRMCQVMADTRKDGKLGVSRAELGTIGIVTYETLCKIQSEYPNDTIYYIAGADKLYIFNNWKKKEQFLSDFKVLVFERVPVDRDRLWNTNGGYRHFPESFTFIKEPDGISDISSTFIRRHLTILGDDTWERMVIPEVANMLKGKYV